MLIYEYLPNEGSFSFVLCPAIPQVTILNVASQLSCSGLLWGTSSLPLAQAIYKLKQTYIWNLATKNQLQILLSTYMQREKKKKEGGGWLPRGRHSTREGVRSTILLLEDSFWTLVRLASVSLVTSANQALCTRPPAKAGLWAEYLYGTRLFKLLSSSMTKMPNNTDLPFIPRSGKNPIETLYNPRFCLSNLGT